MNIQCCEEKAYDKSKFSPIKGNKMDCCYTENEADRDNMISTDKMYQFQIPTIELTRDLEDYEKRIEEAIAEAISHDGCHTENKAHGIPIIEITEGLELGTIRRHKMEWDYEKSIEEAIEEAISDEDCHTENKAHGEKTVPKDKIHQFEFTEESELGAIHSVKMEGNYEKNIEEPIADVGCHMEKGTHEDDTLPADEIYQLDIRITELTGELGLRTKHSHFEKSIEVDLADEELNEVLKQQEYIITKHINEMNELRMRSYQPETNIFDASLSGSEQGSPLTCLADELKRREDSLTPVIDNLKQETDLRNANIRNVKLEKDLKELSHLQMIMVTIIEDLMEENGELESSLENEVLLIQNKLVSDIKYLKAEVKNLNQKNNVIRNQQSRINRENNKLHKNFEHMLSLFNKISENSENIRKNTTSMNELGLKTVVKYFAIFSACSGIGFLFLKYSGNSGNITSFPDAAA